MNVRRHVAKDMRTALAMVRDEHGADAVILSNKRIPEGIEIIAAADYDENFIEQETKKAEKFSFPAVDEIRDKPVQETKHLQRKPIQRAAVSQPERTAPLTEKKPLAQKRSTATVARQTQEEQPDFKVELSHSMARGNLPAAHGITQSPVSAEAQNAHEQPMSLEVGDVTGPAKGPEVIWTQEAMMTEMRSEISSLRSLVEKQISGLAWGDMGRRHPVRANVLRKLAALGIEPEVAKHIAHRIPEELGHKKAWFRSLAMLGRQLPIAGDTILTNGGVVALVGPAGVGKTTLIAKLAAQFAARHGRENVALITTDSQRFGAFDQLRNLGSVMKIPVRAVDSEAELINALDAYLDKPLVLIDTAGLSHRDTELAQALTSIKRSTSMLKAYLVMSASTQAKALEQMFKAYKQVEPCGCIISKIDESTSLGPVISAIIQHKLPLAYFSEGQKIPDDLSVATIQEIIGKAVAISKSMNAYENCEEIMMEQIMGDGL